ncbi:Mdm33 family-domain-containing protein [Chaetomium sp. MPI-SDFR-AT-0129]|nr:Mdm33 family-domain-containing protein [Chaetomium sp. MPI-SDFR-AT-0129]
MSAHTALRLAARPMRRLPIFDQLAVVGTPKPFLARSPTCLRCRIVNDPRSGFNRLRFFSTTPPPPRQPPPPSSPLPEQKEQNEQRREEVNEPEPASNVTKDVPHSTSSSSPLPPPLGQRPEQSRPKPDPQPSALPSNVTPTPTKPSPEPKPPTEPDTKTPPPRQQQEEAPKPPAQDDPSLPSFSETHRHPASAGFSTFMDNLQSRALNATQKINDLTGYSAIEEIKRQNSQLEVDLAAAQQRLRAARHDYKSLTSHRASTQREVTALLARKDTWNPADLERFTTLYRSDHELETRVAAAAAELTEAESDESRLGAGLNAGILKRYHEEQIWSDRIRRQSTWGTWGLMGVNVLLFLVLQFVAEPWRRRRLINGVAESEKRALEEVRRELGEVRTALEASGLKEWEQARERERQQDERGREARLAREQATASTAEATTAAPAPAETGRFTWPRKNWKETLHEFWEEPELIREAALDLSSDRRIDLRMRDATLIAVQGAAAGATVALILTVSLFRNL